SAGSAPSRGDPADRSGDRHVQCQHRAARRWGGHRSPPPPGPWARPPRPAVPPGSRRARAQPPLSGWGGAARRGATRGRAAGWPGVVGRVGWWPMVMGAKGAGGVLVGPLAVDPKLAGQGIGRALMWTALDFAACDGYRLVLLVGDLDYYGRFGFVPADPHGF